MNLMEIVVAQRQADCCHGHHADDALGISAMQGWTTRDMVMVTTTTTMMMTVMIWPQINFVILNFDYVVDAAMLRWRLIN